MSNDTVIKLKDLYPIGTYIRFRGFGEVLTFGEVVGYGYDDAYIRVSVSGYTPRIPVVEVHNVINSSIDEFNRIDLLGVI